MRLVILLAAVATLSACAGDATPPASPSTNPAPTSGGPCGDGTVLAPGTNCP